MGGGGVGRVLGGADVNKISFTMNPNLKYIIFFFFFFGGGGGGGG